MSESWKRPKLEIPKTKGEWVWDIVGYSFFVGSLIFLIYHWDALPDKVPAHFNALGEVDRWGSKVEMLILPLISAVIAVSMHVLEKYPEVYNYPVRFNLNNAKEFYFNGRIMLNQLKAICLILLSLITYESISIALGWGDGFGAWFLPFFLLSIGIPMITGLVKQRKIK